MQDILTPCHLRYQREDRDLEEKMAEQGIRIVTPSSTES